MSQKSPPTYNPPAPTMALSGAAATQQGIGVANQYFAPQMNAQAQGIADINQGQNYYNNFGPSTLSQAVGNQYMNNIWPNESAMISNQFANSGMQNSPALASTMANAYGNLGVNVGEYEQNISNQNATNNLGQLMSINPNNYYQPITSDILNQSNINTGNQNSYQQALAAQQYQQAYNNYSQKNALASTIGQISPLGGQIYGGITGTSGSALSGTEQTLGQAGQLYLASQGMGGLGGGGNSGSGGFGNNITGMGIGGAVGGLAGAMYGSNYNSGYTPQPGNGAPPLANSYVSPGAGQGMSGGAVMGGGSAAGLGNAMSNYMTMAPYYQSMMGQGAQNNQPMSNTNNVTSGYGNQPPMSMMGANQTPNQ